MSRPKVEIAGLIANEWSVEVLLTLFFGTCALVFVGTMGVVNKVHPNLRGGEKAAIWWFVLCMPPSLLLIRRI